MKKKKYGLKLSRGQGARRALSKSLISSLILEGSIKTTVSKAKFILPVVHKLVRIAKNDTLSARRRVYAYFGNKRVVTDRLFSMVPDLPKTGKLVQVTPLRLRRGDNAKVVKVNLMVSAKTEAVVEAPKKEDKKKAKKSVVTKLKDNLKAKSK